MKSLLVTLADENYIDQAKQLFSSVYFNAGWQGDYMLLAHEIPEEKLKWFRDKGILIKKCKPIYHGKLKSQHPSIVLDKFYLFTTEFKKWNNIVFLDADIIVRHSLQKLSQVKGFHAVIDFGNNLLKKQFYEKNPNDLLFNKLSQNFNLKKHAFNTGVMAFSTDIITNNSFIYLKKLFKEYREICKYGEQPIINLCFYKQWKRLGFFYNVAVIIIQLGYHIKDKKISGVILHFLDKKKPWDKNNYFYKEWKNNLDKADLIDLNNRKIKSVQIFTQCEKYKYILYIRTIKIFFDFYYFIDKQIGKIGIFLKIHFPQIYYRLKNDLP